MSEQNRPQIKGIYQNVSTGREKILSTEYN